MAILLNFLHYQFVKSKASNKTFDSLVNIWLNNKEIWEYQCLGKLNFYEIIE